MNTLTNICFWVLFGSVCFVILTGCDNPNRVLDQRIQTKTESYRCVNADGTTSAKPKTNDSICN